MEKRAIIAVAISLAILIGYQLLITQFFPPPPPPKIDEKREQKQPETPPPPTAETAAKPSEPAVQATKPASAAKAQAAREITVDTDDYIARFTSQGARLKSFKLKHYRATVDENSPPLEMVPTVPGIPYPLGLQVPGANFNDESIRYSVEGGDLHLSGEQQGRLVFKGQGPNAVVLTKEFTFTARGYAIRLQTGAAGAPPPSIELTADGQTGGPNVDTPFEGLLAEVNDKLVREHGDALKGKEWTGKVGWAGLGHTYFLMAALPEGNGEQKIAVHSTGPTISMSIAPPAQVANASYTLFIGPKELDILKSLGRGLERSIDFGYFAFISIPLLYVLHFFDRVTASYGLDIILLTVLIKVLLAPLTHKSMTSMKKMQKLQPQMERLKEKYKDDKEGLNKEIMELYRRNGVNPFGGCLPIFIGLYNALRTPIELRHAHFLWIKDLSRPDWQSLPFSVPVWWPSALPAGIPVLTLLMGASMFLQQWMTPSAGDPNQKRMMMMMPLVFTFMFINFPSGLTIYWLVNNLLSIGQQYLINRSQH
jgi:YidC/Oxa1 family membrane protein insertase